MTLEQLSYIATILGLPAIALTICYEIWKAGKDRDRETQLELSGRYGDFLRCALERPELELADFLEAHEVTEVFEDKLLQRQKLIAMQSLVSVFEDAHFLFSGRWSSLKKQAWTGWEAYIEYWMRRPDFRTAWHSHFSSQYNKSFMDYMSARWPVPETQTTIEPDSPDSHRPTG